MQYQNRELAQFLFFTNSNQTELKSLSQLKNPLLNSKVYFHPASYPRISRLDSRQGSCFADWYVPTEGEIFNVVDNRTIDSVTEVKQDLDLEEYQSLVDNQICKSIIDIYNCHNIVNLLYSGGSDSTVVLSYIMKLGLASRTRLICQKNNITQHPESLSYNIKRQERINNFFQHVKHQFEYVGWETIDMPDMINLLNQGVDYHHVQNYSLSILFKRYHDQAWITGMHGNRTLLHYWAFLDQLRLSQPDMIPVLQQSIVDKQDTAYSHSIQRLKFDQPVIPMKYVTHCSKPLHLLDGYCGNRLYSPLGCKVIFENLRRVKLDQIDVETVADIKFVKFLITKNYPDLLCWMDQKQSSQDFINLVEISVPSQYLNFEYFKIPMGLNHDSTGLEWLQQQLVQSQKNNTIEINFLVSVKNLQWIWSQINNSSNAGFF